MALNTFNAHEGVRGSGVSLDWGVFTSPVGAGIAPPGRAVRSDPPLPEWCHRLKAIARQARPSGCSHPASAGVLLSHPRPRRLLPFSSLHSRAAAPQAGSFG